MVTHDPLAASHADGVLFLADGEREVRDALAATLYVGTSEIQRNLVAGLRGLG